MNAFNVTRRTSEACPTAHLPFWQVSTRKVGGLTFIKVGRFTFMVCLSKEYRPL